METEDTTVRHTQVDASQPGRRDHGTVMVLAGPNHGALIVLEADDTSIGRGRGCHICISDDGLSRLHARILRRADGFWVQDAGSKNGTYLRGERLTAPARLEDGDRIALGVDTVLRFSLQDHLEHDAARRTVELTIRDPLTQLFNRGHLEERLISEFGYAERHHTTLHVMMLDLDHFKEVNDSFGHQAGDRVLRQVAATLQDTLRVEDIVGRYGGEEFLVVTRGIGDEGAHVLAERLRARIEALQTTWEERPVRITVSVGVAERTDAHKTCQQLVADADAALYRAKSAGRNRVVVS
jgi:two-component system cell cycle response regulator